MSVLSLSLSLSLSLEFLYIFSKEIGSYHTEPQSAAAVVVQVTNGSDLLAPPLDYKLVWDDRSCGATYGDCGIWEVIPPEGYVSLGSVVTDHAHTRPDTEQLRFRCVHRSLVARVDAKPAWRFDRAFNIRRLPCCTVYRWDRAQLAGVVAAGAGLGLCPVTADSFRAVRSVTQPITDFHVLYDHGCHRTPGRAHDEAHHHRGDPPGNERVAETLSKEHTDQQSRAKEKQQRQHQQEGRRQRDE
jgi:Vacuolar protein sorting-associated protein 62